MVLAEQASVSARQLQCAQRMYSFHKNTERTTMHYQNGSNFNSNGGHGYSDEPLYSRVVRRQNSKVSIREPPSMVTLLEARYGGRDVANRAASIIQRAYRASRLQKQFSKLLSVALSTECVNKNIPQEQPKNFPDPIDYLILRAAGLSPDLPSISSPASRKFRNRNLEERELYLKRSASMRVPKKCSPKNGITSRDDIDLESSHVPPPCPPLRGDNFYPQHEPVYVTRDALYHQKSAPQPPQRTVSFLARGTLPRKISQVQKESNISQPEHIRTFSTPVASSHIEQHFRTHSSPAPLSPPLPPPPPVEEICSSGTSSRCESPLPPPPYIPPPSPSRRADDPLPPPPAVNKVDDPSKQRSHSDSGSTASSLDSGFHSSSRCEVVTDSQPWLASPNFIGSPESLASLGDCVFEPRPLSVLPEEIYEPGKRYQHPLRNTSTEQSVCSFLYEDIYKTNSVVSTPPKVKKTVRILTPEDEQHENEDNEQNEENELFRRRQYRVGLNLFNMNPERGMEYLWKNKFLDYSPAAVAKFFRSRKGLSKKKIGEYLCSLQRPFNLAALNCFIHDFDFTGLHLDIAIRQLQQEVTFPGEAQQIAKLMEAFSRRYIQCNQMFAAGFNSPDTIFVLSYAVVLLNTDLHATAIRANKRMKKEDFVRNLRGVDCGSDVDEDMLKGIYDRIRASEFRPGPDHVSQVARVEEVIVGRKRDQGPLAEVQRRLVCFCRLTEVPDINKRVKRDGAHQRGLFLFNDVLVVCKTVTTKRKTVHQYRYSIPIKNLRINVFSTNQFNYGIQLQDKSSGKVLGTFNAKNESDQQRFVTDLQEAVAEMAEMERVEIMFNELETMC